MEKQQPKFDLERDVQAGETKLKCPVCGYSFTALTGVDAKPLISDIDHQSYCRLSFLCEKGHVFEYFLNFRRGETLVELQY